MDDCADSSSDEGDVELAVSRLAAAVGTEENNTVSPGSTKGALSTLAERAEAGPYVPTLTGLNWPDTNILWFESPENVDDEPPRELTELRAAVPALTTLLSEDTATEIETEFLIWPRSTAVEITYALAVDTPEAVNTPAIRRSLVAIVEDPTERESARLDAIRTLGALGTTYPEYVDEFFQVLVSMLYAPNTELQLAVVDAIGAIGHESPEWFMKARPDLRKLLARESEGSTAPQQPNLPEDELREETSRDELDWDELDDIEDIDPHGLAETLVTIVQSTRASHPDIRAAVCRVCCYVGRTKGAVVEPLLPELVRALEADDPVRKHATRTVALLAGDYPKEFAAGVPALVNMLSANDSHLRFCASVAIREIVSELDGKIESTLSTAETPKTASEIQAELETHYTHPDDSIRRNVKTTLSYL